MSDDAVYQTRLVDHRNGEKHGRNIFDSPEAAKHYLQEYIQIRFDATPRAWRKEKSPKTPKWSMQPEGFDGRAVVDQRTVHGTAEHVLEKTREVQREVEEAMP